MTDNPVHTTAKWLLTLELVQLLSTGLKDRKSLGEGALDHKIFYVATSCLGLYAFYRLWLVETPPTSFLINGSTDQTTLVFKVAESPDTPFIYTTQLLRGNEFFFTLKQQAFIREILAYKKNGQKASHKLTYAIAQVLLKEEKKMTVY